MFQHLRVLELASVLAGPSVGQFFAELGATVVKVENLKNGGDVTRTWKSAGENTDDRSAYFCSVNWGKKSVAIDLESQAGRDAVYGLSSISDVVIASYKPGDAEKLGVDFTTLSKYNPQLIYGQITGYGNRDKRVGYDAIIQAEAGFMYMNGEPGGASLKMPVALMDVLAAHHLKEALLLALLQKERTGSGKFVEVSLIGAAISSLVNQATNWLVAGIRPGKQGSLHPNIAPYGDTFVTADGKEILLAVGTDKQFNELCTLLQLEAVASDPRYSSNTMRVKNRGALAVALQEKIGRQHLNNFIPLCHSKNIPAAEIRSVDEVFGLPQAEPLILSAADFRGVRTFACDSFSSGTGSLSAPPHFGEHTEAVLSALGL